MPFVSRAQSRFFHAAAQNPKVAEATGVPSSVAKKFVKDSHGQKIGDLPDHVEHKAEGGAVEPRKFVW